MAVEDEFQWIDWSNVPGLLDWVGFVLGALGIGFTIFELLRQRGALKAAKDALIETRDILIQNQLGSVLPVFEEISDSINASLAASPVERWQVEAAFGRFVSHAYEAMSLLQDSQADYRSLTSQIQASVKLASKARSDLYDDATTPIGTLVARAATSVRDLAPQLKGASVSLRNDPGRERQNA